MKKAILPIFVLAMLLALVGSASASPPERVEFSITGETTILGWEPLPSGLIKFYIMATGVAYGHSTGVFAFEGDFVFEEWGIGGEVSGQGINHGIMTITATPPSDSKVIIRFGGRGYDPQNVEGNFTVLGGTGDYAGHGQGTYTSIPPTGLGLFAVEFTGQFHTHPQ